MEPSTSDLAFLERNIAELQSAIARARSRLDDARARGVRPRGLGAGIVAGVLVVVLVLACIAGFFWVVGTAIGRVG